VVLTPEHQWLIIVSGSSAGEYDADGLADILDRMTESFREGSQNG
jgi:hypothetical protein